MSTVSQDLVCTLLLAPSNTQSFLSFFLSFFLSLSSFLVLGLLHLSFLSESVSRTYHGKMRAFLSMAAAFFATAHYDGELAMQEKQRKQGRITLDMAWG